MGNIEDFKAAMELLQEKAAGFTIAPGYTDEYTYVKTGQSEADLYMSNMDNWCLVHATRYMPPRNSDGHVFIPTTSMATNFDIVRPTVHATLNHVVSSNSGGNWDDAPYVILAPYNHVVNLNGNPQEISQYDTYFVPNPDTGLVLPKNAYLIQPSNDEYGELYAIGEHGARYKTNNFTNEEINFILSKLDYWPRYEYQKYLFDGDLPSDSDVKFLLGHDDRLFKVYNNSNDKRAFLRGVTAENRNVILTSFLRNIVVELAMEKLGFRCVEASENADWTNSVARIAREHGIPASENNKGHSTSVERDLECGANLLISNLEDMYSQNQDIDKIFSIITHCFYYDDERIARLFQQVVWCMKTDKPLNLYPIFQAIFAKSINRHNRYKGQKYKNIADYNHALDITMQRTAIVAQNRFAQWLNYIKRGPKYEEFKLKLTEFINEFDQESFINASKWAYYSRS